jgi:hypothetical protein
MVDVRIWYATILSHCSSKKVGPRYLNALKVCFNKWKVLVFAILVHVEWPGDPQVL